MPDYEYERVVVTTCSTVCTPDNQNHALYVKSTAEYCRVQLRIRTTAHMHLSNLYIQYIYDYGQMYTVPVLTGSRHNGIQTPSKRDPVPTEYKPRPNGICCKPVGATEV